MKFVLLSQRANSPLTTIRFFLSPYLATLAFFIFSQNAFTEELYYEHHVHMHGVAQFTLVVDRSSVVVDLDSPAMNLLGFEHVPISEEESLKVRNVVQVLKNSDNLIQFSSDAECTQIHSSVSSGLIAQSPMSSALPLSDLEKGHIAFEVGYLLECKHPENIHSASFPVFIQFKGIDELNGQWVIGDQQGAGTFTLKNSRIDF